MTTAVSSINPINNSIIMSKDSSYEQDFGIAEFLPFLFKGDQLVNSDLPNFRPTTLMDKQITLLSVKCGLIGRKFSYYVSDRIISYGSKYSLGQAILFGPAIKFTDVEEFLIAKEFCKIKSPQLSKIVSALFVITLSVLFFSISLMAIITDRIEILPRLMFPSLLGLIICLFPQMLYKESFILSNDVQAARAIGFDKAINALKILKNQKQDQTLFGFKNPTYDKRIQLLESYKFLGEELDEKDFKIDAPEDF